MVKFYNSVPPELSEWCLEQSVFYTASSPLVGEHINVSPKGMLGSSFSFLGPNSAAYVDLTGSGNETISHIYENGRVTILFNSFDATPRILRLFCTGRVLEAEQLGFMESLKRLKGEKLLPGARAIIFLDIFKVQTSCGYGVPELSLAPTKSGEDTVVPVFKDRKTITNFWMNKHERGEVAEYQRKNNAHSLDGLPGLVSARRRNGERLAIGNAKARIRRALASQDVFLTGVVIGAAIGAFSVGWVSRVLTRSCL